jgi:hypothetical protein
MTTPISAHGTLIARAPAATPAVFTTIAELGDFTLPEMTRNEFDASVHNRNIDNYVLGILRRGAMTFPFNFIPTDPTQDHLTGLYKAIIDNAIDGYRVTLSDGTPWIMSGQVQAIKPTAPVDGKLTADVTLRFSGYMSIAGVLIGL